MTSPDRRPEQRGGGTTHPRVPESLSASNIIWVNPVELMQDNPAALIVNTESYNRIGASFSVEQFDPPQTVRVRTYTAEGGEVIRRFVVDGHTRTKYSADHPDIVATAFAGPDIPVRDVTASSLKSPIIVPNTDREPGQEVLTMVQYLRAVVPPTVEHSQIAPDRIASHLINGWKNMVGEDLAAKFSAIAALSLLENPRVPIATDDLLNRFLTSQAEIMAGETQGDRTRLQKALIEMASIIRQTKLFREKVAESAFTLVASGSPVIGGEKESLIEIYGLLHTPAVEAKISAVSVQAGEKERTRFQLGQLIAETFKRFAGTSNREQNIAVVGQALRDAGLNLSQINDIFTSPIPSERYDSIRQDVNAAKLRGAYITTKRTSELSEVETTLVSNLGRRTFLDQREVPNTIRIIGAAVQSINQAVEFRDMLVAKRSELLASGVNEQTIDGAIAALELRRENVMGANSAQTLTTRTKEIRDVLSEVDRKIKREAGIYKTGQVIDEVYGENLKSDFGPQVRNNIIVYILREVADVSDTRAVRQMVSQLKSLDNDLQSKVLSGEIRFLVANRMQNERRVTPATSNPSPQPPRTEVYTRPVTRVEPPTRPSSLPTTPSIEDEQVNKQAVEERRKATNNERLNQSLRVLSDVLSSLDLEQNEVTSQNAANLDEVIRGLGKLRFDHPDIVRALNDYLQQLKLTRAERESRVQQDREQTDRDTRTSR